MSDPRIKKKILEMLTKEFPKDFSIKEVADKLRYHRQTISKYLQVLKAEKNIRITRNFGKINLYSLVEKEKQ